MRCGAGRCPGNDHRLGASEAPPAIISIFLGDQLTEVISSADAVCNTVPAEVFSEKVMEKLPRDAPLIDLAGSITGSRVIRAPGLPGKYAPEAAGMILAESLKRILKREGLL